jgi:hypothetical protein
MASRIALRLVSLESSSKGPQLSTNLVPLPDGVTLAHNQSLTDAIPVAQKKNPPESPIFTAEHEPENTCWRLINRLAIDNNGTMAIARLKRWAVQWVATNVTNPPDTINIDIDTTYNPDKPTTPHCQCRIRQKTWIVGAVERKVINND